MKDLSTENSTLLLTSQNKILAECYNCSHIVTEKLDLSILLVVALLK